MATYIFEVQNLIKISVVADSKSAARENLIDNLLSFADEMMQDCYVSDGEKVA